MNYTIKMRVEVTQCGKIIGGCGAATGWVNGMRAESDSAEWAGRGEDGGKEERGRAGRGRGNLRKRSIQEGEGGAR